MCIVNTGKLNMYHFQKLIFLTLKGSVQFPEKGLSNTEITYRKDRPL